MLLPAIQAGRSVKAEPQRRVETTNLLSRGSVRSSGIPPPVISRLLLAAGKSQRFNEVVETLKELKVKLETKVFDEVLTEAVKRNETVICRQLYQLANSLSIPKSA